MKILKRIFYRGCLKDLCFLLLGIAFWSLPIVAKFVADFLIYKIGV